MRHYVALIHKDANTDYGVSFPDFPGCVSAGATEGEAIQAAHEALQLHVDGMLEDGERIPEPTAAEVLPDELRAGAVLIVLVGVRLPGRERRATITADEHFLDEVRREARARNMTMSRLFVEGARLYLRESGSAGQPGRGTGESAWSGAADF